jgi:predicted RNA-binding protein
LVSFDDPALPLAEQIRQGMTLFERIDIPEIKRNLLLHPNGTPPETLADLIVTLASQVDFVGLTEKDLGSPWFFAVEYVRRLRKCLDAALGRYMPIHIFGCLDPRTLPYLFFAGADVFDGLAWMRYYFHSGHTLYAKEFGYAAKPTLLEDPKEAIKALLSNNIEELEKLRSDLRYTILTTDMGQFEECFDKLQALESADKQ